MTAEPLLPLEARLDRAAAAIAGAPEALSGHDHAYALIGPEGVLRTGGRRQGIFRVASMTKSFTAALVLGVRDGLVDGTGPLDLDARLDAELPELLGSELGTARIREALTMSTGLPVDDPWADRLEAITAPEFSELIGRPLILGRAPGTGYEYSNLGYALLGAIVERRLGRPLARIIDEEILAPRGLDSSSMDHRVLPAERLVTGLRLCAEADAAAQPFQDPGGFSAIGGLLSTVDDLARWVAAFTASVREPEPEGWNRVLREMQQIHRFRRVAPSGAGEGYGFGLHVIHHPQRGVIVHHSGGYPGFGSHMRWHPASGHGVVVLGATSYVDAQTPAAVALEELLAEVDTTPPAWPAPAAMADRMLGTTIAARAGAIPAGAAEGWRAMPDEVLATLRELEGLIRAWDERIADRIFADNVDRDLPRPERRAGWAHVAEQIGEIEAEAPVEIRPASTTRASWIVEGTRGRREVTASVSPLGQIQEISVRMLPDAD